MYSLSHAFDIHLAAEYGVEEAILISHFQYWISHNRAKNQNHHDGKTWTYQTRKDIAAHFPYWTPDKVRRLTDKLCEIGILVKGNYNKMKMDQTIWYAFKNEEMFTIGKFAKWADENVNWVDESAKPIPDTKTDTIPKINNNRERPPKVPPPDPVESVVVSSCEDEELKRAVLDKVEGLSASVIKRAMRHTLEEVIQAVECLEQSSRVKCVNKFMTAALNNGWRPNEGVVKKEPETTLFKAIVLKASEIARELASGFTATLTRISHSVLPGGLKTSDGGNSVSEWLDKLFSMLGYDIRATDFLSDIDIYEQRVRELTA